METCREFFKVEVTQGDRTFSVLRPASINRPYDHAVMFIKAKMVEKWRVFCTVRDCLIYWPDSHPIPPELQKLHKIIPCSDPRLEYCRFFHDNHITGCPPQAPFRVVDGAWICDTAEIGAGSIVMPGAYIGPDVVIGENTYIGAGAKLVGRVRCGDNVIIRENVSIGADGRTTDRDRDGRIVTMPHFGGVVIGDEVEIGASTIVERGAIDDTVVERGCKIDCQCLIGHNSFLGADSVLVGGTVFLGSVHAGERSYFAGNVIVRNQLSIGANALIGMGSVVTKAVADGATVFGNPARPKESGKNI